uniref:Small ribosomal subunit protein uS3m n=1 Tax=Cantharellus cibarius TaxID=36066 RepID=M1KF37_CANCI|nr:ribosomal protein S3 [Cantharellus cibarius]AGE93540.1 ribosomal protein S3 [Cantharellus cibarius]
MLHNLIPKLTSKDFKINNSVINDKNLMFYNNMQNNIKYTSIKMKLSIILNAYFKHLGCLISEPVINITPNKLNIHIFYYKRNVVNKKYNNLRYEQIYYYIVRRSLKSRLSKANLNKFMNYLKYLRYNNNSNYTSSLSSTSSNVSSSTDRLSVPLNFKNTEINRIHIKAEKLANKYINQINSFNNLLNTYYLNSLGLLLSNLLQTHVEIELVRLTYPYHESKILSELVGINGKTISYSRIKYLLLNKSKILTPVSDIFNKKVQKNISSITPYSILHKSIDEDLFKKNLFSFRFDKNQNLTSPPSANHILTEDTGARVGTNDFTNLSNDLITYLTGIKLRISGRLTKQRVVPKRTVKTAYKGGISENKNNIVESSTFTHKNKKGAFSIRIWLSHGKIT